MSFELLPYTSDNLLNCLVNESKYTSIETIVAKRHKHYFDQYLVEIGAKTIVIENDYIDRDYLEDYAAYYDRCFTDYPRRTRRLHFFSLEFKNVEFESKIASTPKSDSDSELQENYLGFIVVKPLPITIIGRTCLKTYGTDGGRRQFPSLRAYPVNLFGIELEVTSLAYQEQDTVVAACATSALWTCLHGTGKLFQHPIPAPVAITSWAGDQMPENLLSAGARTFPNNGLTAKQMAHAIKRVDLEPYVVRAGQPYGLNSVIYAYLRGRIPSILSCQVSSFDDGEEKLIGPHSVAVTGFSLSEKDIEFYEEMSFKLRAARIDKFYVHDDQTGPFSRMTWQNLPSPLQMGLEFKEKGLQSSWSETTFAMPDFLLLPLYHKIRIPFSLIHDAMAALDTALVATVESEIEKDCWDIPLQRAEWDIYLTTVNDYKKSVRSEYIAAGLDPTPSLHLDLPRFLWRVIARSSGVLSLDVLFDATGIAQHNLLLHVNATDGAYPQALRRLAQPQYKNSMNILPLQARVLAEVFSG